MLRPFILLLSCLTSACNDDSSDDGETMEPRTDLAIGDSCVVGVDSCKLGAFCSFNEYGCDQGVCVAACEYDPLDATAVDPCNAEGRDCSFASEFSGSHQGDPMVCYWFCDAKHACPDYFEQPLVCASGICELVDQCGGSGG